jgi:hypothetical protein
VKVKEKFVAIHVSYVVRFILVAVLKEAIFNLQTVALM